VCFPSPSSLHCCVLIVPRCQPDSSAGWLHPPEDTPGQACSAISKLVRVLIINPHPRVQYIYRYLPSYIYSVTFLNVPTSKTSTRPATGPGGCGNPCMALNRPPTTRTSLLIDDLLQGLGFQQCKDDAGLYFRIADGSIIVIYIDDLLCAFHSRSAMIIWKKGHQPSCNDCRDSSEWTLGGAAAWSP